MPILLPLGNDIVDLNSPGISGKSKDKRFVNRVFCIKEQSAILTSSNPDLTLWMMWAAKETAYKIISKIIGPPVFAHKKFEVKFLQYLSQSKHLINLCYQKWNFEIKLLSTKNYIHADGAHKQTADVPGIIIIKKAIQPAKTEFEDWENKTKWKDCFTGEELSSIHKAESALVRYYCKKSIADKLKIEPSRLKIIRPERNGKSQPPILIIDNKRSEIDISLSHHGSWIGWCYSITRLKRVSAQHI